MQNYIVKVAYKIATTIYNSKILTSTILKSFSNYFQTLTQLILLLHYVTNRRNQIMLWQI